MNKKELVKAISERTDMSTDEVSLILDVITDVIQEKCSEGEQVKILGFGTFLLHIKKATTGVAPKTGEKIDVPEKRYIKFRPGGNSKF